MNKIIVVNENIEKDIDDTIKLKVNSNLSDVTKIEIDIIKDTSLEIFYKVDLSIKLDIKFNIMGNVKFNLFEHRIGNRTKAQYNYNLQDNSKVLVNKFYDAHVRELTIINLNGIKSDIEYHLKAINNNDSKYDMVINHNCKNTVSNIYNHAVNLSGNLIFNVTSVVPNNIVDCTVNQFNRIVNLKDDECIIKPILLIDENDVTASHSALIGRFSDEEIFYLRSRGITYELALNLLIKGFLTNLNVSEDIKEQIKNSIDKYWR